VFAPLREELLSKLGQVDASLLTTGAAADLLEEVSVMERALAGTRLLVAERAAASDRWKERGKKSPEDWLADQAGSTKTEAERALATSEQLAELDATKKAALSGDLSARQAELVAAAAAVNPRVEGGLLRMAGAETLPRLAEEAARIRHAADPDPAATERRARKNRELRFWDDPDGSPPGHRSKKTEGRDTLVIHATLPALIRGELGDDTSARPPASARTPSPRPETCSSATPGWS
jgi:hypothetical protein